MPDHTATIDWVRGDATFNHETFPKAHIVQFAPGQAVQCSAAVGYGGDADRVDPESMLVASVASCHMLTFLALAAKKRLVVDTYHDEASGELGKNDDGKMVVTDITLRPGVTFVGDPANLPDGETIRKMHDKAHAHCFIANSVSCAVAVEPR